MQMVEHAAEDGPAVVQDWRAYRDEIKGHMEMMCEVCEGEGLADLMDAHPKDEWKKLTDAGLNFNTDKTFSPYIIDRQVITPAVRSAYIQTFTELRKWRAQGYQDNDYSGPTLSLPRVPLPILMPFVSSFGRAYLFTRWRLNYDHFAANPPTEHLEPFNPGIHRAWCVSNLLAILDDRNYADISGFEHLMDQAAEFTVTGGWAFNFNRTFSTDNPYTGEFGASPFQGVTADGSGLTNREEVFLTDGLDDTANGGPWVDQAERDRRLDAVDQILGDATPRE